MAFEHVSHTLLVNLHTILGWGLPYKKILRTINCNDFALGFYIISTMIIILNVFNIIVYMIATKSSDTCHLSRQNTVYT